MRRLSLLLVSLACTTVALAGCADDNADDGAGLDTDTPGDGDGDSAGDGDGDGDGDGGGNDAGDGDGDGAIDLPPAGGIAIRNIYANSAVRVPVAQGDSWVDASGRTTIIPANRFTSLRVMVDTDPAWVPRDIAAKIFVEYADGETLEDYIVAEINGPSTDDEYGSSINIELPGDYIRPDMKFQVSLFEADPANEGVLPVAGPVVSPAEPALLGVEATDRFISVTVVPIYHNVGANCPSAPEITEQGEIQFAEALKQYNPVNNVYVKAHPGIEWTTDMSSFSPVLSTLAQLRSQDGAAPGEYYYGVVRPCDSGPGGGGGVVLGQAIDIPGFPTQGNGGSRTSVGRWSSTTINDQIVPTAGTLETFVHEVGHTQGRYHSPCGGAGGPDPSYPFAGGEIGGYGLNRLKRAYYGPSDAIDYMGYCDPAHVSLYTWNKVLPYITEISSWGSEGDPDAKIGSSGDDMGTLLVGLVDGDGSTYWHTEQGYLSDESISNGAIASMYTLSSTEDLNVSIGRMGDNDGFRVAVALPEGMDTDAVIESVQSLELFVDDESVGWDLHVDGAEITRSIERNLEIVERSRELHQPG